MAIRVRKRKHAVAKMYDVTDWLQACDRVKDELGLEPRPVTIKRRWFYTRLGEAWATDEEIAAVLSAWPYAHLRRVQDEVAEALAAVLPHHVSKRRQWRGPDEGVVVKTEHIFDARFLLAVVRLLRLRPHVHVRLVKRREDGATK